MFILALISVFSKKQKQTIWKIGKHNILSLRGIIASIALPFVFKEELLYVCYLDGTESRDAGKTLHMRCPAARVLKHRVALYSSAQFQKMELKVADDFDQINDLIAGEHPSLL